MRPPERRETGEQDLFRSRLDQIIDLKHPLVALGRTVDWEFLEREFGAVYTDDYLLGPRISSAPRRKSGASRCIRGTAIRLLDELQIGRQPQARLFPVRRRRFVFRHHQVAERLQFGVRHLMELHAKLENGQ